jgi:hypothetical protein
MPDKIPDHRRHGESNGFLHQVKGLSNYYLAAADHTQSGRSFEFSRRRICRRRRQDAKIKAGRSSFSWRLGGYLFCSP